MNKITKKLVVLAALLILVVPVLTALPVKADDPLGINDTGVNMGLPTTTSDPKEAAISIVTYLMTFLGLVAVIFIIYGGFQWLTAGGNEDRVGSAKKTIIAGLIGLVIIIAAYAIVQIVVGFAYNIVEA